MNTRRTYLLSGLFLLFAAVSAPPLQAEWSLSESRPLAAPEGIDVVQRRATRDGRSAELHIVTFKNKTHTLAVMDNPEGAFTLATAAEKRGALAAVNGGYFHPDRRPIGLVVRQGSEVHGFERARLLSGLVVVRDGRVALQRAGEFKRGKSLQEALQAGPFLIDGGRPVAGLNAARAAARTIVFVDGSGACGLMVCRSPTLAEAAEILATSDLVPRRKIIRALNLDGGSSTGLWVRGDPPLYLREARHVRNYLAVIER